jgi:hypothetical protein
MWKEVEGGSIQKKGDFSMHVQETYFIASKKFVSKRQLNFHILIISRNYAAPPSHSIETRGLLLPETWLFPALCRK